MWYRGYRLEKDDPGACGVEIYDRGGELIETSDSPEEAIRTVDEWLYAQ